MQKYYKNLDDYNDHSPSRLMELTKQALPSVIFVGSIALLFMFCGSLEVM